MSPDRFRDWIFERLMWVLINGEWVVKIKDFKNSKNKKERSIFGLVDQHEDKEGGIIYLDKTRGTPKILVHELGHVLFGDILDREAIDKNKTAGQIDKWTENEVLIFERVFYGSLSKEQISALKVFITKARIEFKRNLEKNG